MARDVYVDATLFMGMHSVDPAVRASCVAFFAEHLHQPVVMTYEEVGRCDDLVWSYPRQEQDAYYPFMDVLHSIMPISRRAYTCADWQALAQLPARADGLELRERMLLASVLAGEGELVTINPRLTALAADGMPVSTPLRAGASVRFEDADDVLDTLYRTSLTLEVDHAAV
ncbi:hypothetical protein DCW30_02890 [Streptomyces alfalfae]|uniref:PIN domain-containing protein n=1 Tax=Streptomyces alfalfae TaxID=1642299 RepID=A0ABN4VFM5_9ACTN|nr:DUF6190 family protein [Streptomyces alfalfae]APY84535.1 hypothetical protein A7J05_00935 [Streptomyces alfalfae]RXX47113.1 hypothetical protein DCW30_02890 [Streptomyces alfalfae]RZM99173.1 hypothetical protein D4104_10975 [Streptomyces alfalfae]